MWNAGRAAPHARRRHPASCELRGRAIDFGNSLWISHRPKFRGACLLWAYPILTSGFDECLYPAFTRASINGDRPPALLNATARLLAIILLCMSKAPIQ